MNKQCKQFAANCFYNANFRSQHQTKLCLQCELSNVKTSHCATCQRRTSRHKLCRHQTSPYPTDTLFKGNTLELPLLGAASATGQPACLDRLACVPPSKPNHFLCLNNAGAHVKQTTQTITNTKSNCCKIPISTPPLAEGAMDIL